MGRQTVHATTFTCSLERICDTKSTFGGLDPDEEARKLNWIIGEPMLGHDFDLCPEHADELREFLFGSTEHEHRQGMCSTEINAEALRRVESTFEPIPDDDYLTEGDVLDGMAP